MSASWILVELYTNSQYMETVSVKLQSQATPLSSRLHATCGLCDTIYMHAVLREYNLLTTVDLEIFIVKILLWLAYIMKKIYIDLAALQVNRTGM